jgi:hypothetical protein
MPGHFREDAQDGLYVTLAGAGGTVTVPIGQAFRRNAS